MMEAIYPDVRSGFGAPGSGAKRDARCVSELLSLGGAHYN